MPRVISHLIVSLALLVTWSVSVGSLNAEDDQIPKPRFDPIERNIEGWTVHIDPALVTGDGAEDGERAITMLQNHLQRIAILVPEDRLKKMRTIEIWIEQKHPELRAMQYHPGVKWLTARGYDARLVKKVHIPQARELLSRRQLLKHPAVILHELAHGYHDQILSFNNPRIINAYDDAMQAGTYDSVLLHTGRKASHYAKSNHKEYFAEGTEAYLYRNDFFPFVGAELEQHDPTLFKLLEEIWGPIR